MIESGITAVILTKNEELNIERCIKSVKGLVNRIVVVDSGSTDRTVLIAQNLGADIYLHPFTNYARQFNWALDHTDISTMWVYRIDADEAITKELKKELYIECMKHASDDVNGFLMKHKLYFLGRYLTHGGTYPFVKMTVFKPEFARFEEREMGEHVILKSGRYLRLKNDCLHYDCKDITTFINKHNWYATREVKDYYNRTKGRNKPYKQAAITQKLKDGFYYRLPEFTRAKLYYWYRYYLKLGFLDGEPGKIYALLQAYFYRVMVDAKIYEMEVNNRRNE